MITLAAPFNADSNTPPCMQLVRTLLAASLIILQGFNCASAATTSASFYSDSEYTSNARLESTDTEDDFIQKVGLSFSILEERKRFNADAKFNLSQDFYLNKTYSDQTQLTTGFGLFNFDIVEEFLDWRTSFTRSQVFSSALTPDTPDNRQERNTFKTGPAINYRINRASNFRLSSNYVQVENSSKESVDTRRGEFSATYSYILNSITVFNIGANYDRVFSSDSESLGKQKSDEVRKRSVSAGVSRQFPQGDLVMSLGKSYVSSPGESSTGSNYAKIDLQRRNALGHDLSFSLSRDISDSSIGFDDEAFQEAGEDVFGTDISASNGLDIITKTNVALGIKRSFDLFVYRVNASWSDIDYTLQNNDERFWGTSLELRNRPEKTLNMGVSVRTGYVKPLNQESGNALTQTYTVDGKYQWLKKLGFNGAVSYERRGHSSDYSKEYEEFSLRIGVFWTLL